MEAQAVLYQDQTALLGLPTGPQGTRTRFRAPLPVLLYSRSVLGTGNGYPNYELLREGDLGGEGYIRFLWLPLQVTTK